MKKKLVAGGILAVVAIAVIVVVLNVIIPNNNYNAAVALMDDGKYEEAITAFKGLNGYKDSEEQIENCEEAIRENNYNTAVALMEDGQYDEAKAEFIELGDYKDSTEYVKKCDYEKAQSLYDSGDFEAAIEIYETISDYKDSSDKIEAAQREIMYTEYEDVFAALKDGNWYFGGSDQKALNQISFTDEEAEIAERYFDGNGIHDGETIDESYMVDDKNITIAEGTSSELVIPYKMQDGEIQLGDKEYFTPEQIEAKIQGYWTRSSSDYNYIFGISMAQSQILWDLGFLS